MEGIRPAKVAVVGVGSVGSSFAYALLLSGLASEIVLIDANERRAEGEAMDLQHAVPFAKPVRVWAASYTDCEGAAVTVIAAGAAQKEGETRLDLVRKNAAIFGQIVPQVAEANPSGIILVATNPVDVLSFETGGGYPVCHRNGSSVRAPSWTPPASAPPCPITSRRPALSPRVHRRRTRR